MHSSPAACIWKAIVNITSQNQGKGALLQPLTLGTLWDTSVAVIVSPQAFLSLQLTPQRHWCLHDKQVTWNATGHGRALTLICACLCHDRGAQWQLRQEQLQAVHQAQQEEEAAEALRQQLLLRKQEEAAQERTRLQQARAHAVAEEEKRRQRQAKAQAAAEEEKRRQARAQAAAEEEKRRQLQKEAEQKERHLEELRQQRQVEAARQLKQQQELERQVVCHLSLQSVSDC